MEAAKYSVQLADTMKRILDEAEFKYDFYEDRGVMKFRVGLGKGQNLQNVNMFIIFHEDSLTSYASASIKVNESSMSQVAEFIARANYGLRMGNFELDYNDGEVRYKCFNRFGDSIPSESELWYIALRCPGAMWERYGNAFLKVVFGGANPKDAIAEAEKDVREA